MSGRRPNKGQGKGRGQAPGKGQNRGQGQSRGPKKSPKNSPRKSQDRGQRGGGRPRDGADRRRRTPKGLGGDQVEGRQAVRELLLAGRRRVHEVLMIDDLAGAEVLEDIRDLCGELGVTFRPVSRRHLNAEALTESHQGVVARAAPLSGVDIDDLMADPNALLVVLDGVTDPGNLGALLRTAECAGVTGVVLGRHRSVRISPTVTKTAAGAVEHVPLSMVGGIPTAVANLTKAGFFAVGLDGGGDRSIFDLPEARSGPVALVLGAEGTGLSRLVRQRVDVLASIPVVGSLNSLNVAMAAAVACFEMVRVRN